MDGQLPGTTFSRPSGRQVGSQIGALMLRWLIVVAGFLIAAMRADAADLTGRAYIIDGDTIEIHGQRKGALESQQIIPIIIEVR